MIKKADCVPGTKVIVNKKATKWNMTVQLNKSPNSDILFAFPGNAYDLGGMAKGIPSGTELEILSKPKRGDAGTIVLFKVLKTGEQFATWWICLIHKVDKI